MSCWWSFSIAARSASRPPLSPAAAGGPLQPTCRADTANAQRTIAIECSVIPPPTTQTSSAPEGAESCRLNAQMFGARSTESSLRRQHAARSQCLPEILVLMLKDNLEYTIPDVHDERGIDRDIDRWCRFLKAPYEPGAHHCVIFVHPRFV